MLDATKNFVKDIDDFKEQIFDLANTKGIVNMSVEEFGMVKMAMKLIDDYNEIITRQAIIIEEQDRKIDKILRLVEKN